MRGWNSMTSAKPKSRRGRSGSCADRLAGSGSGGEVRRDGGASSVGWLLLSALIGQPGSGQELAEPGLGPAVGESTKDVAEVLEGRRANQIAVDDESMQNREPAGTVVGAGKQEIPAPDGGTALLALDMGVGQRDPRIVEEDDEGRPLVDGVRDGLAQRTLGRGAGRRDAQRSARVRRSRRTGSPCRGSPPGSLVATCPSSQGCTRRTRLRRHRPGRSRYGRA